METIQEMNSTEQSNHKRKMEEEEADASSDEDEKSIHMADLDYSDMAGLKIKDNWKTGQDENNESQMEHMTMEEELLDSFCNEHISDDMLDEQELINNYWQMPLPKMSTNQSYIQNECFTFNEVIATNNAAILEDMTENELHDIDLAIDEAMEDGGEICSIRDLIRGQWKPSKLRKIRDLKPVVCMSFATISKGKTKHILIRATILKNELTQTPKTKPLP